MQSGPQDTDLSIVRASGGCEELYGKIVCQSRFDIIDDLLTDPSIENYECGIYIISEIDPSLSTSIRDLLLKYAVGNDERLASACFRTLMMHDFFDDDFIGPSYKCLHSTVWSGKRNALFYLVNFALKDRRLREKLSAHIGENYPTEFDAYEHFLNHSLTFRDFLKLSEMDQYLYILSRSSSNSFPRFRKVGNLRRLIRKSHLGVEHVDDYIG